MDNLIYIEWVDSYGCTSRWEEIKEIEDLLVCKTAGFLISETDEVISVANSIANESDRTEAQMTGVMTIPKKSIIKKEKLTCIK